MFKFIEDLNETMYIPEGISNREGYIKEVLKERGYEYDDHDDSLIKNLNIKEISFHEARVGDISVKDMINVIKDNLTGVFKPKSANKAQINKDLYKKIIERIQDTGMYAIFNKGNEECHKMGYVNFLPYPIIDTQIEKGKMRIFVQVPNVSNAYSNKVNEFTSKGIIKDGTEIIEDVPFEFCNSKNDPLNILRGVRK